MPYSKFTNQNNQLLFKPNAVAAASYLFGIVSVGRSDG